MYLLCFPCNLFIWSVFPFLRLVLFFCHLSPFLKESANRFTRKDPLVCNYTMSALRKEFSHENPPRHLLSVRSSVVPCSIDLLSHRPKGSCSRVWKRHRVQVPEHDRLR